MTRNFARDCRKKDDTMLSGQQCAIIEMLLQAEYMTAEELADKLGIGVKTVRIRIKEINDILHKHEVGIVSKPRYGYAVRQEDDTIIRRILEEAETERQKRPDMVEDRVYILLAYLINQNGYIKADDICDFLYISKSTLTYTLRQAEEIYRQYNLSIEKRPNYGLKVKGSEFNIRQCMTDVFMRKRFWINVDREHQEEVVRELGELLNRIIQQYNIQFSEISYNDFIEHIYVAMRRIQQNHFVDFQPVDVIGEKEWQPVETLVKQLEERYDVIFPKIEKEYLALQLAGKSSIGDTEKNKSNFVIQSELDGLVIKMIDLIFREFQIDFRSNFELRMSLNQHMVPLGIRLRYKIILKNPMLEEVKSNYIFAYTIAARASSVLKEHYQSEITEDEIGYLAVIFELALEQRDTVKEKISILIVCASGKSSSRLLKYKYSKEFEEYIDQVFVCNIYDLELFDFSRVSYVFATVPILIHVPVPILEVNNFLGESDSQAVKNLLEQESKAFLNDYYSKELFFTGILGETKEDVLKEVCTRIQEVKGIPDSFYDSVLRREALSSTDFGNLIAIPHPDQAFCEKTFVTVAILEKPIFWERNDVQIIILMAIGTKEDKNIQKFYEITTKLILRTEDIPELLKEKNFDTFMYLLKKR